MILKCLRKFPAKFFVISAAFFDEKAFFKFLIILELFVSNTFNCSILLSKFFSKKSIILSNILIEILLINESATIVIVVLTASFIFDGNVNYLAIFLAIEPT